MTGIIGLLPSINSTSPNTTLNFAPGFCRDKDQSMDMSITVGWTKTTGPWSAGTGNGMLDTNTIAANSGYHRFAIYNPTTGLYDYLCSLSPTAPNMPSGFTVRKRLDGFTTDASGNIKKGVWYPNGEFRFEDAFVVVSAAPGNALSLKQLPLPLGVKLKVYGQAFGAIAPTYAEAGFWIIIRDPDLGAIVNDADQWYEAQIYKKIGSNDGSRFDAWADASGQVYYVTYPRSAGFHVYIYLQGYFDPQEPFL